MFLVYCRFLVYCFTRYLLFSKNGIVFFLELFFNNLWIFKVYIGHLINFNISDYLIEQKKNTAHILFTLLLWGLSWFIVKNSGKSCKLKSHIYCGILKMRIIIFSLDMLIFENIWNIGKNDKIKNYMYIHLPNTS